MATLERIFPMGEGSETSWALAGTTGYQNWSGFFTTEAPAQIPFPKCTVRKVVLRVLSNTLNENTVVTLRQNGGDTGITFTIPAAGTGLFTATGTVLVADGDLLCLEMDGTASSSGGIAFQGGSVTYV